MKDADRRCGHVLQNAARMQALEIAHELVAHPNGGRFDTIEAMEAIAVQVAKACLEGRVIRSLGFIAKRMLCQLDAEDDSAIMNRRSWRSRKEIDEASDLALQMLDASAKATPEIKFNRDKMLSTSRLEILADMIKEHSRGVVITAYNLAQEHRHGPGEGYVWTSWAYLKKYMGK